MTLQDFPLLTAASPPTPTHLVFSLSLPFFHWNPFFFFGTKKIDITEGSVTGKKEGGGKELGVICDAAAAFPHFQYQIRTYNKNVRK